MRFLVLANQTLGGAKLREKLREISGSDTTVHLVVPATPVNVMQNNDLDPMEESRSIQEGRKQAQHRLRQGLGMLSEEGLSATGEVGHPDPIEAIADALAGGDYDEIIISTLPGGFSRWLKMDLPSRAGRKFDLPVTHVEASS